MLMTADNRQIFAPSAWAELPLLAGYRAQLERLVALEPHWPDVEDYADLLGLQVRCHITQRLPAGLDASDIEGSYVGQAARGDVPTRPRNLHDLLGALVWARFPLTKSGLCARQVAVATARGAVTNRVRNREQDFLAMIDEGGIFVVDGDEHVFGHALLEDAIRGRNSRGFRLDLGARGHPAGAALDAVMADFLKDLRFPTAPSN